MEYTSRKSSEWRRGSSHQVRQTKSPLTWEVHKIELTNFGNAGWDTSHQKNSLPENKWFRTIENVQVDEYRIFNYLSADTLTLRDAGKKVRWLLFKSKIFVMQLTFSKCYWWRIQDTKLTSHSRVWNTNCKLIFFTHRFNRNWFVQ